VDDSCWHIGEHDDNEEMENGIDKSVWIGRYQAVCEGKALILVDFGQGAAKVRVIFLKCGTTFQHLIVELPATKTNHYSEQYIHKMEGRCAFKSRFSQWPWKPVIADKISVLL
jgi:hypothetical protein